MLVSPIQTLVSMVRPADWKTVCERGTDATTTTVRVTRTQTGKRRILVTDGASHGATSWCAAMPGNTVSEQRAFISKY